MLPWGSMERSIYWGKHEKRECSLVPTDCSSEQEAFVHGDKLVLEPRAVQVPPCKGLVTPVVTVAQGRAGAGSEPLLNWPRV